MRRIFLGRDAIPDTPVAPSINCGMCVLHQIIDIYLYVSKIMKSIVDAEAADFLNFLGKSIHTPKFSHDGKASSST